MTAFPPPMVSAHTHDGVVFEHYRYAPGPAGTTQPHVHDTYQLCLSLNFPGEYRLGAADHAVPPGSFSLVPPGVVHRARDPMARDQPALFLVAYFPAARVAAVAADLAAARLTPADPRPVFTDQRMTADFTALGRVARGELSCLEADERLLRVIANLLRDPVTRPAMPPGRRREQRAVAIARDYLRARLAEPVALADLARVTGLSAFRLARSFRAEVGLPPHAYHLAVRIDHAKQLLVTGMPAAHVATVTGFCDQSHLTRQFQRLVGTSPGRYTAPGKIVQAFP